MDFVNKRYLALAIAVSLGCGFADSMSVTYAEEAAAVVEAADDELMDFDLESLTVEAKRPDWESKLSPGTMNIVRPDDFKGEQKTLPDLLLTVPGVHVREVNGKGQYTTVTMRGSTAAQVGIFIDGVLANLGGDTAVDLSTIPVKNVERVEVYRGYVPSRFGGTFMGGVINIVTKKPETTNVSLELGKSSYGGKRGSMEITAPLGSGSLMVATNYESSDGDFKYKNYAADRYIPMGKKELAGFEEEVVNFNNNNIDILNSGIISLEQSQVDSFKNDNDSWVAYVRASGENSLANAIYENRYEYAQQRVTSAADVENILIEKGYRDKYFALGFGEDDWLQAANEDWRGDNLGWEREQIIDETVKNEVIKDYADANYQKDINEWQTKADPDKSEGMAGYKEKIANLKKRIKEAQDATRYRKYNDYEKTSSIIKWQNDNWVVKASYNKTDRHMPDSVWGGSDANAAPYYNNVDLYDTFYYSSKHQKQDDGTLMLQNRHNSGKLEWGWMLDYMHSNKHYKAEHIVISNPLSEWEMQNTPLREWSEYKSNKGTAQIDGSYKLNDNNMLDFLINYSKERMTIDGSNMDRVLSEENKNSIVAQIRNKYDQELLNIQLQDSITLDKAGSWIFTPSVRYNQSKIVGYSDGKRFGDGYFKWISPKDSQTNGKTTWQLALKKEFNENLTLRMTGGTYYRLLNMAEIAGDGAGVLPAPSNYNGDGATFPVPEEGKQFDFSIIANNKFLGAENATTLTYYWRDSTNMVQLERAGRDYWCYFNDNKGRSKGVELQSSFKWNKFDLDLQTTYLQTKAFNKHTATGDGSYGEVWPTYQPKWEGNLRVTYRPSEKFSIFTEGHYTGEYFTYYSKATGGRLSPYLSGKPVASILVMNSGLKWMPEKNWQLTFGCNDVFNEGPKSKIRSDSAFIGTGYINPEFPIQGRTYYVTARYQF